MPAALSDLLPPKGTKLSADELLSRFLSNVSQRGLTLYPAQEEAILELLDGKHVVLTTPTGSGKSLVAEALHFKGLAEGKRSFYTSPIKALVNEKFFALCETFGPANVGMMTGDASVNRDAPIICCTAEILSNLALREEGSTVDYVVMDEFHYYADRDRGWAWQLPLLSLPRTTFLLMSATLGPTDHIVEPLEKLSGRKVAVVTGLTRPVPLDYQYVETPVHETIADLIEKGQAPIYLVNFTQRAAAEQAQALTSVNLCSKEEKEAIRKLLFEASFDTPYGKDIERYLKAGIGLHHAGVMPKYRRMTERLAQKGLLKVISGTDTLGMGINIPIRTVLFTQLCKFDGEKMGIMKVREFHQIAGRAGRKGFDDQGLVAVQAPEHVIENLKLAAKNPGKKFQRKQPPTKGYVHWDKATFERLQTRPPEPLESRFQVTHGMLVNLLQADEVWENGGYGRLVELIARSHESENAKRRHKRRAKQIFQALRHSGLIEVTRYEKGAGAYVEVSPDLQADFSLYHTLALFLVSAVELLDKTSPTYALDLLSLVESILENPDAVLFKQKDRLAELKLAELKAQGVPYEERIEELQKVEPLRPPNAELIWGLFAGFAEKHPWVASQDVRTKSVVRDMFEKFCSFNDYIVEYGLQRSEGVLLRYLSECYRVASHTVPEAARDEAFEDVLAHLRQMLRAVDSSLIDEWERMRGGEVAPRPEPDRLVPPPLPPDDPKRLAEDPRKFNARLRNELHQLLKALAEKKWEDALAAIRPLAGEQEWTIESLEQAMAPYFAENAFVDLKPVARLPHNTVVSKIGDWRWEAIQKVVDPEGETDWMLDCIVDLEAQRDGDQPLIALRRIGT